MFKITIIDQTAQTATLIFQLLITVLFCRCALGLNGGVAVDSILNEDIEVPEMDPLSAYMLGDLVIDSMTLSRRNTRSGNQNIIISDVDENGKYVGIHSNECSKVILMPPPRTGTITVSPELMEKGEIVCHWKIIGTKDCLPNITCINFNFFGGDPNTTVNADPCPIDYMEITDGSHGYQKFCGMSGPMNLTTRRNAREIYITLKLGYHARNRLLGCVVRCITADNDDKNIKPLEDKIEPLINPHCKCGRKKYFKEDSIKHEHEVPWIAALVVAGTRNPFCIGTIINDRFILTAAHCFRGSFSNVSGIEVLIHPHSLNASRVVKHVLGQPAHIFPPEELKTMDDDDGSVRYRISRYIQHPLLVKQTNDFDVALVKLARPIDFNNEKSIAVPICIPEISSWDVNNEGESALLFGWSIRPLFYSRTDNINILRTLEKRKVEVFRRRECNALYSWRFSDRFLCAGIRDANSSSIGDIGSPLIIEKSKGVWEQIGLLTYGQGIINKKGPGIHVHLRQVSQWIRQVSNFEKAVWCADNSGV